ncbi:MAG: hypothetical protein EBS64_00350 [Verrucomicrobia bacterium]|nr:hypothetical protein [Verrucomicrobiota bacterium]
MHQEGQIGKKKVNNCSLYTKVYTETKAGDQANKKNFVKFVKTNRTILQVWCYPLVPSLQ